MLVAGLVGLRWGEAAGRAVHHIDFDQGTIGVEQQVTRDGELTSRLKTKASRATLRLSDASVAALGRTSVSSAQAWTGGSL